MPNGHLIHPTITVDIVTEATSRAVAVVRMVNGATFASVLIWASLALTITIAAVAFIRRNT